MQTLSALEELVLQINLSQQVLSLVRAGHTLREYPVSSAKNGPGEEKNSFKTPRGWHQIRAKIGATAPINAVFVGRRPTGEIFQPRLKRQFPKRDWILTRILWLSGLEPGKNRFGQVDSMQRYIYIHGTPDTTRLGYPGSRGCIRMGNNDIIWIFDRVVCGTRVFIF